MDQLSVSQSVSEGSSQIITQYTTVAGFPLPMHLHLRPGSLYQPARPALRTVWCALCIRSSWAWKCLDSASMIPRNDQASVRQYARAHSVWHRLRGTRESSWAAQGCGKRAINSPRRAGPASIDSRPRRPHTPARQLSTSSSHLSVWQAAEMVRREGRIAIKAGRGHVYAVL